MHTYAALHWTYMCSVVIIYWSSYSNPLYSCTNQVSSLTHLKTCNGLSVSYLQCSVSAYISDVTLTVILFILVQPLLNFINNTLYFSLTVNTIFILLMSSHLGISLRYSLCQDQAWRSPYMYLCKKIKRWYVTLMYKEWKTHIECVGEKDTVYTTAHRRLFHYYLHQLTASSCPLYLIHMWSVNRYQGNNGC